MASGNISKKAAPNIVPAANATRTVNILFMKSFLKTSVTRPINDIKLIRIVEANVNTKFTSISPLYYNQILDLYAINSQKLHYNPIIVVSIKPPINKNTKDRINNFIESLMTSHIFTECLLLTAADIRPPAIAPIKYAPISNEP